MKNVLFYYPSNKRSIALETIIFSLQKEGIQFSLLTTCKKGAFHEELEKKGVKTYTNTIEKGNSLIYYIRQIVFLIRFTRKNNFDFVFSHLQHTNFICVLAQFFITSKCIVVRHHFKFSKGFPNIPLDINRSEQFFDKMINRLAKKIIVPSIGVYNGMKKYEKVNMNKVEIIPYIYDFSSYAIPNEKNCQRIKSLYSCHLLVIMASRLIPFKRHSIVLPVIDKLTREGLDIKMVILDSGPEENTIKEYIANNKLEDNIFMLGYTDNLIDYMNSSDILIMPSLTEASNNVVKEMGLLGKTVAVCKNVGDFDDYIQNGKNGFILDIEKPEKDIEQVLRKVYQDKEILNSLGQKLKKEVMQRFNKNSITLQKYKTLFIN